MALDGAILLNLFVAGVLTLIVGAGALVLLQRAILRNMAATGGRPPPDASSEPAPRRAAEAPLRIAVEDASRAVRGPTGRILLHMAAAHIAAGLAYAVAATVLLFLMSGIGFNPLRTAVVVWAFAWPTVLVLNFLTGPDRRLQLVILLGYLGVLLAFGIIAGLRDTPPMTIAGVTIPAFAQPLLLWLLYAAPTVFLLLFLNRTIRTIGPLVLASVFVLLIGSHIALAALALHSVSALAAHWSVATGVGVNGTLALIAALGMLLMAWPAWRTAKFLRDRYVRKRTSDFLMTVGAIWLLQALMLSFNLFGEQGVIGAASAVLPLIAWRLVLGAGLYPIAEAARARVPQRLLLLRVFGFGRRSRRLLDLLGARWRLIGNIDLIAAPDLASRAIEPATFIEFLRRRLPRLFIRDPARLEERLAAIDCAPDPDGRYRINQLFCGNDMWKAAVSRLMGAASLVVMDLRGFGPQRRGCVYELQTLLDLVPLDRLAFLFDATTDRAALEGVLTEHWRQLSASSPNLSPGAAALRMIDATGSDVWAVLSLLAIVRAPGRAEDVQVHDAARAASAA